jgi:hypothetical protein
MTEEQQPESKRVQVRTMGHKGKSALVQTDDLKRYYVPANKVVDDMIDEDVLLKGVRYGIPWEAYLGMDSASCETLGLMLRKAGIYTLADLEVRDRQLIRIGTNFVGKAVREAARMAEQGKPPRSK